LGSRRRNLIILALVGVMLLASAFVIATKPTVLGLDLRGGTELVYQGRPTPANPEISGDDMDRAIEIIRERTDKLGVSEPEISRVGTDQIRIGLPNVANAERAAAQVGSTSQLYFYDWEPNVIKPPGVQSDYTERGINRLYDAVVFASKQTPECPDNQCTTTGPTYYMFNRDSKQPVETPDGKPLVASERSDLFLNKDLLPKDPADREIIAVPRGTVVVQQEATADDPSTPEDESDSPRGYFVLHDRPEISGDDIRNPEQNFDPTTNQPIVTFDFTDEGRDKFAEVTKRIAERGQAKPEALQVAGNAAAASNISDHFAVVLDREVVSRPIINFVENPSGIDGRNGAEISGTFSIQEAQDLAEFIKIGALPIDLKLISQSTVSATLGQKALDQGLKAGIAGLILVLLFLIAYYRVLGVVASVGLLIYGVFFFALVKLIPITLTLPGIAGLILTIGVAADANIVIFERIREEARAGKSIPSAIATGYRKGIATIIDANVITLVTAFILFVLATSGVKGFAFTLGVGTIASLFTAVVFTQAFLGLFGRTRLFRSPKMIGRAEERVRWHFDFTGLSRWFFSMSGCILLIGGFSFATNQLNLGLDFESGTRITAGLQKETSVDDVRTALADAGIPDTDSAEIQQFSYDDTPNGIQIQADLTPAEATKVQPALTQAFGEPKPYDNTTVGPTFGAQVARSAILAVIFSLLVICAYVAFRFEGKYAVPVIIALLHDVLITGGVYSLVGREVTSGTVAAFLTILGYSMYDTVIVFDRIRENVPRLPRAAFSQIVNRSMSEVLTRSLITGLSSVFLVTVLFLFGGATLKDFAFAMMVGIASGTYSSIFIAAPVLTHWKEREPAYRRRRERIEEQMGGVVPPFPEENVVARLEDEPEAPAEAPGPPQAPAPSRADVGRQPPPTPPPAPAPPAPARPAATPAQTPVPTTERPEPEPDGDGAGETPGDGAREAELSEASAAALRRLKERGAGKKRRRHGRPR
jgi:SecD/SecF fusion protein